MNNPDDDDFIQLSMTAIAIALATVAFFAAMKTGLLG